MNDQKIRKLHQSNKEKLLDLWKALSGHLKQLAQLKAIPMGTLVELFVAAFLAHDPDNQRSQRKLMRGGKMNDYSEFEEEEEVDLQNLIGSKSTFTSGSSALSRSHQASKTSPTGWSAGRSAAAEEESDEFDF
ncbi:Anthranilate N-benzoyltransferase protein 1 [Phytophthora nicotianae]|uniref:Anthranilate N-benzoyltransferase protein 1 n=1 Tax=Phytophthora nicotianae TaxID=4792 RepID=A0A0W8DU95_PHYNI|nr:Anthranilate N-benzoyltransferase protein 1 [Phytophthora nicotianae]